MAGELENKFDDEVSQLMLSIEKPLIEKIKRTIHNKDVDTVDRVIKNISEFYTKLLKHTREYWADVDGIDDIKDPEKQSDKISDVKADIQMIRSHIKPFINGYLESSAKKEEITFDLDMYYKGDVVYPIKFDLIDLKKDITTYALKLEDDKIGFATSGSQVYDSVEELLNNEKQELRKQYGNKIRDIRVGNPYIEENN